MRAITIATVIGLLGAASSGYAQGQASASMTVSVRVIRTCTVATPPSVSDSTRITAQCIGNAEPRTQLSSAVRVVAAPAAPAAERTIRVFTVNF